MNNGQFTISGALIERLQSEEARNAFFELRGVVPNLTPRDLLLPLFRAGYYAATANMARLVIEETPDDFDVHRILSVSLFKQERWSEAADALESMRSKWPEESKPYSDLCWIYGLITKELEKCDTVIRDAQRFLPYGRFISFQPGFRLAEILPATDKDAYLNRNIVRRDSDHPAEVKVLGGTTAPKPGTTISETMGWSEIGSSGATLCGRVGSSSERAEYRFEYGFSLDALTCATSWQPVPGNLNARSKHSPQDSPALCRVDASSAHWDPQGTHFTFASPFGMDPNHLSGAGFLSLLYSIRPVSNQPDGLRTYTRHQSSDLRGAEYKIRVRLDNFDSRDFLFTIGLSTNAVPWLLSARPWDLETTGPHDEATATFVMNSDPKAWTFMGNNPNGDIRTAPYTYGPLDQALSVGTDMIFFAGVSGDWRNTPVGQIGIIDADLRYRSRCALNPLNGGRLVEFPQDSDTDPAKLTDGNRGGPDDGWHEEGSLDTPLRFSWRLPEALQLDCLAIHQHRFFPTKRIRVSIWNSHQADPQESRTWEMDLPDLEPDLVGTIPVMTTKLDEVGKFDSMQLEILEGYTSKGTGLEAVELFARDFVPLPSAEPVDVSEDIVGLHNGEKLYYRIAVNTGDQTLHGEIKCLYLPADDLPILHDVLHYSAMPSKSVVSIRGNAMGHKTIAKWKIDDDPWQEIELGWERTPVHRYLTIRKTRPQNASTLKVKLVSEAGESELKIVNLTCSPLIPRL